jgi:hypothetical protein
VALVTEEAGFVADDLVRATRQEDVRGTLGEGGQAFRLLSVTVDGAHQLAFGGKRHLAHTLEAGVERFGREPDLAGCDDQGPLRWVPLYAPASAATVDCRVVRQIRGA